MELTKAECEFLLRKLEYSFKKKANSELETKPLVQCSDGAKLLHRLKEFTEK